MVKEVQDDVKEVLLTVDKENLQRYQGQIEALEGVLDYFKEDTK